VRGLQYVFCIFPSPSPSQNCPITCPNIVQRHPAPVPHPPQYPPQHPLQHRKPYCAKITICFSPSTNGIFPHAGVRFLIFIYIWVQFHRRKLYFPRKKYNFISLLLTNAMKIIKNESLTITRLQYFFRVLTFPKKSFIL
jgi:hypothetical protein